jgi:hypothetical protein
MATRAPLVIVTGQVKQLQSGDAVALDAGGTSATTASGARDNLGLGNAALANPTLLQSGRLTLTTGVPVTVSDVTGAGTVYLTPWRGKVVSIYNGTLWVPYAFSELSRSISGLTSGKNYDVFAYVSGGNAVIDLAPAWTNDTSRSAAVSLLNGVYVNTSSFTPVMAGGTVAASQGTLLGTIRTTGTATTEDSLAKRFVSNLWHPVSRRFHRTDATSHTYSSTTVRGWNGASTHTMEWVSCIAKDTTMLWLNGAFAASGAGSQGARLGLGSVTTAHTQWMDWNSTIIPGFGLTMTVDPQTGYAIYYVTESATGSGNSNYYYYTIGGQLMG